MILFGLPDSISSFGANLGNLSNNIKQAVKNLEVMFNTNLCFDNQVKAFVWSCFLQLNILSKRKSFLSIDLQKVVCSFIYFQLDYYNILT